MPFEREAASSLGGETFLANEKIREAIARCQASFPDPEPHRARIRAQALDVTARISRPEKGLILACDGSRYEGAAREDYPSVKCGFLKFSQVMISIPELLDLNKGDGFVDQIGAAKITRDSNAYGLALSGSGFSLNGLSPMSTFRRFLFDAFRAEEFKASWGADLYDTLVELLRRLGRVESDASGSFVVIQKGRMKNPVTGRTIEEDVRIPVDIGYAPMPGAPGEVLYISDVLRLHDVFVEEGDNISCYQRAMNALEHMLLAHVIRALDSDPQYRQALEHMVVLMDGPLSINGEPAVFHRPIMELIYDVAQKFASPERQPLILGVAKTGPIVEHGDAIAPILRDGPFDRRALLIPIDDAYRYSHIDKGKKDPERNFGDGTHYGQDFLYRSRQGRMFHLCIAYPFRSKRGFDFQSEKVKIDSYGVLIDRAISALDLLETPLYENANIAQHLANTYASIAKRPTGRNIDAFLKDLVRASGATV